MIPIFKRKSYILIGNNNTGKTTFQKKLIYYLCEESKGKYDKKLISDLSYDITHRDAPRKLRKLFTMGRSLQEVGYHKKVDEYFKDTSKFKEEDICILSSHLFIDDIKEMIEHLKSRYYEVEAVFFTNAQNSHTSEISKLDWDGRNIIENNDKKVWEKQIKEAAEHFGNMLLRLSQLY